MRWIPRSASAQPQGSLEEGRELGAFVLVQKSKSYEAK